MLTITPEQDQLLGELGRLQRRSKASYVVELLDGAESLLRALLPVLRAHLATVEGQPVALKDAVARVFAGAYGEDPAQLDLVHRLNDLLDEKEAARARPTRSGAREERAVLPPHSNTGVSSATHEPEGGSKHRKTGGKRG
jgi:hypothetical protein